MRQINIKRDLQRAKFQYIRLFCEKQGLVCNGTLATDIFAFDVVEGETDNDYEFSFNDIVFDIDKNMPQHAILEWFDEMKDLMSVGGDYYNYVEYITPERAQNK